MIKLGKYFKSFSTLDNLKIYNNIFEWNGQKWCASVNFLAPKLQIDQKIIKVSGQSSLMFSIYSKESKYKKGRTSQFYSIRMQNMIKLSTWNMNQPIHFINNQKIITFDKKNNDIIASFYDKNLSQQLRRKEIICLNKDFSLFLDTIKAGVQEITNSHQQKLSNIHILMKQCLQNNYQ